MEGGWGETGAPAENVIPDDSPKLSGGEQTKNSIVVSGLFSNHIVSGAGYCFEVLCRRRRDRS